MIEQWASRTVGFVLPFVVLSVVSAAVASTKAPSAADRAHDRQVARRGLIRLSDFPAGWRTDSLEGGVRSCSVFADLRRTANVGTAFTRQRDDVSSYVRVLASPPQAHETIRRFGSAKYRRCYASEVDKSIRGLDEFKSGKFKLGPTKIGALSSMRYGDETAALQIVVSLTIDRSTIDLYGDTVFVRKGRAVLIANFTTDTTDFDAAMMNRLVRRASGRLP